MMKAWILAGALVQNDIPPQSPNLNTALFDTQVLTQEIEIALNEQMARLIADTQQTLLDVSANQPELANRPLISIQKK